MNILSFRHPFFALASMLFVFTLGTISECQAQRDDEEEPS